MVDNRYTGVGYEPPFTQDEREIIRNRLTEPPNDYGDDISTDLAIKLAASQERERVLREAATYAKIAIDNYIHKEWGVGEIQDAYDKLKAALERKER